MAAYKDSHSQLTSKTVLLHWLIAAVFVILLVMGVYMHETKAYHLYDIHKSIGVLIFLFAVYRVFWRMSNGWTSTVGTPTQRMRKLARLVHWLLIIGTVLMPISGFMMSAMGGFGVSVFGLELVAANPDPNNQGEFIAINSLLASAGHIMHGLGSKILIAAILLHVAGALVHHFSYKDGVLSRMLGRRI